MVRGRWSEVRGQKGILMFIRSAKELEVYAKAYELAMQIFRGGSEAARAVGNEPIEMQTLMGQRWTDLLLGRPEDARPRATEVHEIGNRIRGRYITSFALLTLGILSAESGDIGLARERYAEALRMAHIRRTCSERLWPSIPLLRWHWIAGI